MSMYSDHTEAVKARLDDPEGQPKVVCVKVVSNYAPNEVGVWRKVVAEPKHLNPVKYDVDRKHLTMWDALIELAPPNHHVVAVQSDLRYADKPGDWHPNTKET